MISVVSLMVGATGLTLTRTLVSGGTSADAARVMIGGSVSTALLLALESVQANWARGLALIAFLTTVLVHGVWLTEALLRSLDNASVLTNTMGE